MAGVPVTLEKERLRMKDLHVIQTVLDKVDTDTNKYPAMSYADGVREALMWVVGEIEDEEFSAAIDAGIA